MATIIDNWCHLTVHKDCFFFSVVSISSVEIVGSTVVPTLMPPPLEWRWMVFLAFAGCFAFWDVVTVHIVERSAGQCPLNRGKWLGTDVIMQTTKLNFRKSCNYVLKNIRFCMYNTAKRIRGSEHIYLCKPITLNLICTTKRQQTVSFHAWEMNFQKFAHEIFVTYRLPIVIFSISKTQNRQWLKSIS